MEHVSHQPDFGRLEDFIAFARTGVKMPVVVDLQKQFVSQKVHPGDTEEMHSEMDMYLLSAVFSFDVHGEKRKVKKIYMIGSSGESIEQAKVSASIANARLRTDYERLKSAKMPLSEKFF